MSEKKIQLIIADLRSNDPAKVKKSLALVKTEGNAMMIPALLDLVNNKQMNLDKEIEDIFFNLRDSDVIEPIVELLKDEKYLTKRRFLLTAIWNSSLDFSFYLPEFVAIAVEGDFMEAMDCLTIIENLEGPFEERHVLESQLYLKEYLEDEGEKDPQKAQMISEIALIIKDIDQSIEG